MKKIGKFLLTTATVTAIAGGVYYFIKNVLNKEKDDEFDDFDDGFDDFDEDEEEKTESGAPEDREYVTINLSDTPEDEEEAMSSETKNESEAKL